MKFYDFGMTIILTVVVVMAIVGAGSVYFFGQDNVVEEVAEAVIHGETGIHIDFTPNSSENKLQKTIS